MIIAQLSEVTKSYGSHEILDSVHLQIKDGARMALVGRNGTGKTTLLRILTGELEPERGTVWKRPGAVIAAMEQEVSVEDQRTLRDEAARGFEHVAELHRELDEVTEALSGISEGDERAEELLERYSHLQERLEREDAYSMESRVDSVLTGLHFTETDLDRPLIEFSGGQKSRAVLARVLLRDPDLLLLDEPTNHLDLEAIEWLEAWLTGYSGAYVLISHDRMFVNRTVNEVAEIRYRKLHRFQGNYDRFLVEREERLLEQARLYEMQQAEIRRQEDFVRKNIAGQKTKQAQSRRRMLEKMDRLEAPEWPASSIRMHLPEAARSARIVVEAKGLAKSYGDLEVFRNVSFLVERGQKIGLIGPNGVGKSTLVRILIGQESQSAGTFRVGNDVQVGYYEQEQKELRGSTSVLDEMWSITPQASETEVRTFLGGFLFRGEDVYKSLTMLSGGERGRVALGKLVREGANLLVLDEPTNHLDIESREVFEAALQAYSGTVLVVSHDRYFLDRTVDRVLELRGDGARLWDGGYSQFAEARKQGAGEAKPAGKAVTAAVAASAAPAAGKKEAAGTPSGPSKEERKQAYEQQKRRQRDEATLRKRIETAEGRIGELEARRENLLVDMADPEVATQADRLAEMTRELQKTDQEIQEAITEWERLQVRLEGFLDGAR